MTGIEIDHEGDPTSYWGRAGVVSALEATRYSQILDRMQKSMGGNYTVSADIGAVGIAAIWGS